MNSKAQNERIVIAPIEGFAEELLERIGREVERIYGWATRVRPLLRLREPGLITAKRGQGKKGGTANILRPFRGEGFFLFNRF